MPPPLFVPKSINFCFTSLVITSILANTSGCKLLGIINPKDVFPGFLSNVNIRLVSSSTLLNIINLVISPLAKANLVKLLGNSDDTVKFIFPEISV